MVRLHCVRMWSVTVEEPSPFLPKCFPALSYNPWWWSVVFWEQLTINHLVWCLWRSLQAHSPLLLFHPSVSQTRSYSLSKHVHPKQGVNSFHLSTFFLLIIICFAETHLSYSKYHKRPITFLKKMLIFHFWSKLLELTHKKKKARLYLWLPQGWASERSKV